MSENDEIVAWLMLHWPQYIAVAKKAIAEKKAVDKPSE